jgi:hypothetical protein
VARGSRFFRDQKHVLGVIFLSGHGPERLFDFPVAECCHNAERQMRPLPDLYEGISKDRALFYIYSSHLVDAMRSYESQEKPASQEKHRWKGVGTTMEQRSSGRVMSMVAHPVLNAGPSRDKSHGGLGPPRNVVRLRFSRRSHSPFLLLLREHTPFSSLPPPT